MPWPLYLVSPSGYLPFFACLLCSVFPYVFVSAIVYSLLTECDMFTCLVSTLAYIYLYMLYVYGFCRSFLSKLLLMNHLSLTCFSLIRLSTMIWSIHGNTVSGQTIPDDAFRML